MSATSIVMICFGMLVIVSRGPLMIAPNRVRDIYMKMIGNASTMRVTGIVFGVLAMLIIWSVQKDVGLAAEIVSGFAWFILVMMAVLFIPFPGIVGSLGNTVWRKFSETTLRFLGVLSVTFGVAIVYYGANLS